MTDWTEADLEQNAKIDQLEKDVAILKAQLSRQKDWAQSAISHLQSVAAPLANLEGIIGDIKNKIVWVDTHEQRIRGLEDIVKRVEAFLGQVKHKLGL